MKITKIKTYELAVKYSKEHVFSDAMGTNSSRQALLVKIETDEGISGIGEAWGYGNPTNIQAAIINEQLKPILLDQDPTKIENLYQRMYWRTIAHGRRGLIMGAISGIDIALWDILGKKAGLPIYKLLGGNSNIVPTYASGGFYFKSGENTLEKSIKTWLQKGFQYFKIKIGRNKDLSGSACIYSEDQSNHISLNEDLDRILLLRKLVGPDKEIIVDVNSAWTPEIFTLAADKLKEAHLNIIEEPFPFENIEGYKKIHDILPQMLVMGFEGEQNNFNFSKLTDGNYVDILQPDIGWVGGFTASKKIAAEAESHYKRVSMHSFGSAVHFAASLQMAAAIPNAFPVENEVNYNPLRTDLLKNNFKVDAKMNYILNDKPGLGIDINWDKVTEFKKKE